MPGAARRVEAYRGEVNSHLEPEGLSYQAGGGWWNKNFLWILVEEIGLDTLRERVERPLEGLRIAPFYGCYIVRPTKRLGFDEHPERDHYLDQVIEALGAEPVEYAGARKCCGFPVITMNRTTSLRQAGRHLADAIDAGADCLVTPCPLCHLNLDLQQPAARASWSATSACRCSTCRRWSASRSGSSPKELGMGKHVVSTKDVQRKLTQLGGGLPGQTRPLNAKNRPSLVGSRQAYPISALEVLCPKKGSRRGAVRRHPTRVILR